MKHYILSALAGGAFLLAPAFAQDPSQAPDQPVSPAQHHQARVENQKDRIQNGVRSGRLTRAQARQLGRDEGYINNHARAMAQANGGHLTQAERDRVHRQMNRQSHRIHQDKVH